MMWRCFHCDYVAGSIEEGREHFGASERQPPACQVDAAQLRDLEAELARYREEDTDLHRALHAKDCAHAQALRREEEAGYARGLRDARGQFGVAVELLRECVGPLEVSAAVIESEDGGEAIEALLAQLRKFIADAVGGLVCQACDCARPMTPVGRTCLKCGGIASGVPALDPAAAARADFAAYCATRCGLAPASGVQASEPLTDARIEQLAKDAGFGFYGKWLLWQGQTEHLLRFARAVAASGVTACDGLAFRSGVLSEAG